MRRTILGRDGGELPGGERDDAHLATARVLCEEVCYGPYTVHTLSEDRARLHGRHRLTQGSKVRLLIQSAERVSFELDAQVERVRADGQESCVIELALRDLHPALARALPTLTRVAHELVQQGSATVLVVDDCPNASRAIARDLRRMGLEVLTAATPLEAIHVLSRADLVVQAAIVDFHLGQSVGTELLEYLRSDHPRIRRIFFSGDDLACSLERAEHADRSQGVLEKPWDRHSLIAALAPD